LRNCHRYINVFNKRVSFFRGGWYSKPPLRMLCCTIAYKPCLKFDFRVIILIKLH
jgi:hypothetical protein